MSASGKRIRRVFRDNGRDLEDPAPEETPEQAVKILAMTNGKLTNAKIEGPFHEGDKDVYKLDVASGYGRKG